MKNPHHSGVRTTGAMARAGVLFVSLVSMMLIGSEHITQVGGLSVPRKDHTATVLSDGRVLIVGGENAAGALASAEIFDPVARTFSPAGTMSAPRVRHAATRLSDGRVLITGGRNSSGALAAAEIYDPAAAIPFRALAAMMGSARQYHTSTLLANGKVLLAGGDLAGTGELYTPATETFSSSLIAMIESRSGQTATTMPENSVLLAGGGRRSVEVFDLQTNAFLSWTALLNEARTRQSAITAADGSIYFVGGDPAGTLEKFNLLSGSGASFPLGASSSAATQLANGKILVTGPALASLFSPLSGALAPIANAGLLQRSGQTVTELPSDKQILIAGGVDASSGYVAPAALYNPARIETDKADYYPDEPVIVTGFGWKPGESVDLYVVDNLGWVYDSTVTADADGQFTADPYFVVLWRHLGVTFDLTAVATQSGLRAKHTFTDAPKVGSISVGSQVGTATYGTATSVTYSVTVNRGSGSGSSGNFTADLEITSGLPVGATYSFSPDPVAFGPGEMNEPSTLTISTTSSVLPGAYTFTFKASTSASDFATTTGALTVGKKVITTTGATASNKAYDGNTIATVGFGSASLVGIVSGDIVTIDSSGASGAFANKNVGTGKTVTVTGVALAGAQAARYSVTQPSLTADITAKNLTITGAVANSRTYNGSAVATVNFGSATLVGIVGSEVVTIDISAYSALFNNKNAGLSKAVTVTGVALGGADAGNYTVSQPIGLVADITAKNLTIMGAVAASKVYDGSATAAVNFGGASLVGVIGSDAVTINSSPYGAAFDNKNVGTGKAVTVTGVTLNGGDAGNYTVSQPTGLAADITAKNLTIAGAVAANKVYDGNVTATVSFGSAVLAGVVGTEDVTINSTGPAASFANANIGTTKPVTVTGVILGGLDAGNYTVLQPTGLVADITAKNLTITGAVAAGKVYDGNTTATVNFGSAVLVGVVGTEDVTINSAGYAANFNNKNIGTNKPVTVTGVVLGGTAAANYSVSQPSGLAADITAKNLTITGAVANSRTYNGSAVATVNFGSATLVGIVGSEVVTIDISAYSALFNNKNAGLNKPVTVTGVTLGGVDAGNYTVSQPTSLVADITPKNLTIIGAVAANKVYNGNTTATVSFVSASLVGVFGSDAVTINSSPYGAAFDNKNVGTGKAVTVTGVTLNGGDAGNYTVSQPTGLVADITAKNLTITGAVAANKVYNGNTTAAVSFAGASMVGVVSPDVVNIDSSLYGANFDTKNIGTGKSVTVTGVTLSGGDAGNYTVSQPTGLAADITAKHLTIAGAVAANKVYDGNATAIVGFGSATLVGVVGTEEVTINSTGYAASFANANIGTAKPVTVTGVVLGGLDAGNYTLSQPAGLVADITAKNLTITGAVAVNKIYDGNTTAIGNFAGATLVGVVGSDDVTINSAGYGANFNNKNVGTSKPVTVTGVVLGGAAASNYSLTQPSLTADITAKNLTIIGAAANSRTYNGNAVATVNFGTANLLGIVGSELVTIDISAYSALFNSKNVGLNKSVTVTGVVLGGADAWNYTVSQPSGLVADITAKNLTITGSVAANKVYDGNTTATVSFVSASLVGIVGSETVTINSSLYGATFDNKDVGTTKPVTVTGVTLGGLDAGNYTVSQPTGLVADITPKTLTITGLTGNNKVYDGTSTTTASGTASLYGVIALDSVILSGTPVFTFVSANVANGIVITTTGYTIGGLPAANYTLVQPTLSGNITPATAAIVISDLVRAYTGTARQPTVTVTAVSPAPPVPAAGIKVEYNSADPVNWVLTLPNAIDVYSVRVTITDPNYAAPVQTALFVVYDPTGGFVTGGGWINSPTNAITADGATLVGLTAGMSGKANFGFNAKYLKGAQTPTGNTEFQFQAGNLNFKSNSYEWLVVQGTSKAQFKGVGTINGGGTYSFMLTAFDGEGASNKPDAFRIKIWTGTTTIYDNQLNQSDTSDMATVLGGGSIVIHDPGKK